MRRIPLPGGELGLDGCNLGKPLAAVLQCRTSKPAAGFGPAGLCPLDPRPHPLANDGALKLGKDPHHLKHCPAGRCRRIEPLLVQIEIDAHPPAMSYALTFVTLATFKAPAPEQNPRGRSELVGYPKPGAAGRNDANLYRARSNRPVTGRCPAPVGAMAKVPT